ncbi:hypothetical protein FBR06_09880 [Betaproteobacteria bacterium PRO4]|nr:hypothetical protein [Betaproteobacteria bacterium PRO4]
MDDIRCAAFHHHAGGTGNADVIGGSIHTTSRAITDTEGNGVFDGRDPSEPERSSCPNRHE